MHKTSCMQRIKKILMWEVLPAIALKWRFNLQFPSMLLNKQLNFGNFSLCLKKNRTLGLIFRPVYVLSLKGEIKNVSLQYIKIIGKGSFNRFLKK